MSYFAATSILPTNSTDANFRAWGSTVSAKLLLMGMVHTSDTGQINWTTVTAAVAINTAQGYEIWRFADTLQSTAPVYFKFEFGSGSAVNNPSIWLTVGTGSDGAGNLTGVTSVRRQFQSNATTALTAYWSGDTNRFMIAIQGTSIATTLLIAAERSNDGTDTLTSEAVLLSAWSSSAWSQVVWNTSVGPVTAWEVSTGALGPEKAPLGVSGTQVAVYPVFHNKGVFMNFGLNTMAYVDATLAANTIFSFTVHGVSHTFVALGVNAITGVLQRTAGSTSAILVRYE